MRHDVKIWPLKQVRIYFVILCFVVYGAERWAELPNKMHDNFTLDEKGSLA